MTEGKTDSNGNSSAAGLLVNTPEAIQLDVCAVQRIEVVPKLLEILCTVTGMRFAAVARVTDSTWTACAVKDDINFGVLPGGQLDVNTTLCIEVRSGGEPIVIDHASKDPAFSNGV